MHFKGEEVLPSREEGAGKVGGVGIFITFAGGCGGSMVIRCYALKNGAVPSRGTPVWMLGKVPSTSPHGPQWSWARRKWRPGVWFNHHDLRQYRAAPPLLKCKYKYPHVGPTGSRGRGGHLGEGVNLNKEIFFDQALSPQMNTPGDFWPPFSAHLVGGVN